MRTRNALGPLGNSRGSSVRLWAPGFHRIKSVENVEKVSSSPFSSEGDYAIHGFHASCTGCSWLVALLGQVEILLSNLVEIHSWG